ncbi:HhH-GPD superfamily base excision DNA repair protein [Tritrichomonas foetus]|uniref:Endonuclease III homolog n=1 Tax=Tritrichomonas foetus TaxID=1144522 RepID=A0A1J4K3K3_9EUKA|nr:HhH-GPD superfamily base excision DNA repair protein [Tritrichomonas foetus]|eukprot:OHT05554.1 HhH-GPD superfamily base excision DNA repair protein [Tritrichomonas foetus]
MKKSTPSEQLKTLIEFRKKSFAPVDTMGCSKVGDKSDPKTYRFQTLMGLMLSAQTKDEITAEAIQNLKKGLKGGLTAHTLANANQESVQEMIRKVSFYKTKAGRIIEAAQICERDYDSDIPKTIKDLTALKGVGIKMATLAMSHAWNEQTGIGVDVHVHRIANRLQWVKTKTPEATEDALQEVFPKELWEPLNETIVGFGQTICGAVKQKCELCPITDSCAYYNGIDSGDESDSEKKEKSSKNSKRTKNSRTAKNTKNTKNTKKGGRKSKKVESETESEVSFESEKEASSGDFDDSD